MSPIEKLINYLQAMEEAEQRSPQRHRDQNDLDLGRPSQYYHQNSHRQNLRPTCELNDDPTPQRPAPSAVRAIGHGVNGSSRGGQMVKKVKQQTASKPNPSTMQKNRFADPVVPPILPQERRLGTLDEGPGGRQMKVSCSGCSQRLTLDELDEHEFRTWQHAYLEASLRLLLKQTIYLIIYFISCGCVEIKSIRDHFRFFALSIYRLLLDSINFMESISDSVSNNGLA